MFNDSEAFERPGCDIGSSAGLSRPEIGLEEHARRYT